MQKVMGRSMSVYLWKVPRKRENLTCLCVCFHLFYDYSTLNAS